MKIIETNLTAIAAVSLLIYAQGCVASTNRFAPYNAVVTVRIVDDEGSPIEGANAKFFSMLDSGSPVLTSDTNGIASRLLTSIFGEIDGDFTKPGHYKTNGVFWKQRQDLGLFVPPADTNFTIVLKRIIEPVILKHREVNVPFPRLNEPVGFDLEIGDWVFPDGKGKNADIFLTGTGFYNASNEYAFNMTAEFTGELNGIQSFHYPLGGAGALLKSDLPPPPITPAFGYEKTFERWTRRVPTDKWHGTTSRDDTRMWIFRTRTEVDDDGNIVSANYGWMIKDIVGASNEGKGRFAISYYYNPDPHSRSLEPKEIADRQGK